MKQINKNKTLSRLDFHGPTMDGEDIRRYYRATLLSSLLKSFTRNPARKLVTGIVEGFHTNGRLRSRVIYKAGLREGHYENYHNNGQLCKRVIYIHGKPNGLYESFHKSSGALYERGHYIDGKKNGIWESFRAKLFHEVGPCVFRLNYIDGEKVRVETSGRITTFRSGNIYRSTEVHLGLKHNTDEKYHENGQLSSRENYRHGKLDGLSEQFDEDGNLIKRKTYKKTRHDGLVELFYKNGQLLHRANYKDGKPNGIWEIFHDNSQLHFRGNIIDCDQDGLWEYFDEDGNLTMTEKYKNGELIEVKYNP